jgi:hypothetical protein
MVEGSILKHFDGVTCPFEQDIPKLAQWMDQDQCNNWSDSDARVTQRKEEIGGRTGQ